MKALIIAFFLAALFINPGFNDAATRKPIMRVGEVIIVGNTVTQDRVIRQELARIQPGQILRPRELRNAERKLAALGLFKVDPARKIRPTVQMLQSPGPFKDILVKVEETSTRHWKVEPGLNAIGQPIMRLIMEDRNFDPFQIPPSWDHILNGSAFSGGGHRARIEVIRLIPAPIWLEFFADGSLLPAVRNAWLADWGLRQPRPGGKPF